MDELRIAFLNTSDSPEDAYQNFNRNLDAELVDFDVVEGELPESFAWDGAVIPGSLASVYEDEEWIDELSRWVETAIDRGMPCLGVCFGHQVLAHVLGGTVEGMEEFEIGYRTVEKTRESQFLRGIGDEFLVFQSHGDRVTELPDDAVVIAKNDCGIQSFVANRVYAVQGHPEVDYETALTDEYLTSGDIDDGTRKTALESVTKENARRAAESKRLFDNFVEMVDETDWSPTERFTPP